MLACGDVLELLLSYIGCDFPQRCDNLKYGPLPLSDQSRKATVVPLPTVVVSRRQLEDHSFLI